MAKESSAPAPLWVTWMFFVRFVAEEIPSFLQILGFITVFGLLLHPAVTIFLTVALLGSYLGTRHTTYYFQHIRPVIAKHEVGYMNRVNYYWNTAVFVMFLVLTVIVNVASSALGDKLHVT